MEQQAKLSSSGKLPSNPQL